MDAKMKEFSEINRGIREKRGRYIVDVSGNLGEMPMGKDLKRNSIVLGCGTKYLIQLEVLILR